MTQEAGGRRKAGGGRILEGVKRRGRRARQPRRQTCSFLCRLRTTHFSNCLKCLSRGSTLQVRAHLKAQLHSTSSKKLDSKRSHDIICLNPKLRDATQATQTRAHGREMSVSLHQFHVGGACMCANKSLINKLPAVSSRLYNSTSSEPSINVQFHLIITLYQRAVGPRCKAALNLNP
jgi:hypothetical protein